MQRCLPQPAPWRLRRPRCTSSRVLEPAFAPLQVRMFDLRSLEHSTIIYESADGQGGAPVPLIRLEWNKQDPNYLAVITMDSNCVVILDIRVPSLPAAKLQGHSQCVNSLAWAPHSSCHISTAGDDNQALIWDLSHMPKPIEGAPRPDTRPCTQVAPSPWRTSAHRAASRRTSAPHPPPPAVGVSRVHRLPYVRPDPILAYSAESEVNQLQWSKTQPDWVAIAFDKKLQILRV